MRVSVHLPFSVYDPLGCLGLESGYERWPRGRRRRHDVLQGGEVFSLHRRVGGDEGDQRRGQVEEGGLEDNCKRERKLQALLKAVSCITVN